MDKFLVPRKGLTIRDPKTRDPLPIKGMLKTWIGSEGRYWRRRVNCGDCTIGNPPRIKSGKKKTEIAETGGKK